MTIRPDVLKREIDNLIARFPELEEDAAFMREVLDAETDFDGCMAQLVMDDDHAKAMEKGVDYQIEHLQTRKKRWQRKAEMARSMMQTLMEQSGQKKVTLPAATVSFRTAPAGVVITDENIIPDDFLVTTTRPDKKAIKAALDEGEDVFGATLGNAKMTISVRYT